MTASNGLESNKSNIVTTAINSNCVRLLRTDVTEKTPEINCVLKSMMSASLDESQTLTISWIYDGNKAKDIAMYIVMIVSDDTFEIYQDFIRVTDQFSCSTAQGTSFFTLR